MGSAFFGFFGGEGSLKDLQGFRVQGLRGLGSIWVGLGGILVVSGFRVVVGLWRLLRKS